MFSSRTIIYYFSDAKATPKGILTKVPPPPPAKPKTTKPTPSPARDGSAQSSPAPIGSGAGGSAHFSPSQRSSILDSSAHRSPAQDKATQDSSTQSSSAQSSPAHSTRTRDKGLSLFLGQRGKHTADDDKTIDITTNEIASEAANESSPALRPKSPGPAHVGGLANLRRNKPVKVVRIQGLCFYVVTTVET